MNTAKSMAHAFGVFALALVMLAATAYGLWRFADMLVMLVDGNFQAALFSGMLSALFLVPVKMLEKLLT